MCSDRLIYMIVNMIIVIFSSNVIVHVRCTLYQLVLDGLTIFYYTAVCLLHQYNGFTTMVLYMIGYHQILQDIK